MYFIEFFCDVKLEQKMYDEQKMYVYSRLCPPFHCGDVVKDANTYKTHHTHKGCRGSGATTLTATDDALE